MHRSGFLLNVTETKPFIILAVLRRSV